MTYLPISWNGSTQKKEIQKLKWQPINRAYLFRYIRNGQITHEEYFACVITKSLIQ